MFQLSGFQRNAFQIGYVANDNQNTGPAHADYYDWSHERLAEDKARLEIVEKELAQAEARELERQEAEEIAAKQLEASLLVKINRLRQERVLLIQRIRDEEAILVLLMALKRRRVG
jgi:hypothetical protein